jgi:predicted Zn-dependent peptidase
MSVTLSDGTTTVTLPNPNAPIKYRRPRTHSLSFQTEGGVRYGQDKGIVEYVSELTFMVTTAQEAADLDTLFTAVGGMSETFTLTDWDAAAYTTTRFTHDTLEGRVEEIRDGQLWRVKLGFTDSGS